MSIDRLPSFACLAVLVAAIGCASTTKRQLPAEPMPAAAASSESKTDLALRAAGAPTLDPIYFDTDRALLRDDARETLKRHASAIRQHEEWGVVTIDGHCDERGSEEYNLALGKRRASVVARYLSDLGVPSSRLETRSWGEMRPAVTGRGELAWQRNRRSELRSEAQETSAARP